MHSEQGISGRHVELLTNRPLLSPLRYPGGKRRLVPYVAAALEANGLYPSLFVEPFAGGAAVALELLATGRVERIGLAERDPLVASFWQTVFFDTEWLCNRILNFDVSLATWEQLKKARPHSVRNQALACLFLNRTSFNGALNTRTGPIGGKAQQGTYKIDCRFPRESLVRRIRACAEMSDQVAFVRAAPALEVIAQVREMGESSAFFYLDPPFWSKSWRLYRYTFADSDHLQLSTALRYLREPYLLSYDPAEEIEELYGRHRGVKIARVELLYSATEVVGREELVIANLGHLPEDTRLWRTHAEWQQVRRRREAD